MDVNPGRETGIYNSTNHTEALTIQGRKVLTLAHQLLKQAGDLCSAWWVFEIFDDLGLDVLIAQQLQGLSALGATWIVV